jgi:pyruvate dehydrogenase E2 component (dihydrolipoamide acetyltransferase)
MSDFRTPTLGADMEAGTLVEWLVEPGGRVKRGDVIAVVETQKGAIEVEIFENGTVSELLVPVGRKVPVGTILARIADGKGEAPPVSPPPPAPVAAPPAVSARPAAMPVLASPSESRIKITPAARRRAAELGLEVASLRGTGIDGSVTLADVEAAQAEPHAKPERVGPAAPSSAEMRKAIAAAMSRAKREIPHYYLTQTVDLGTALAWLESENRDKPPPDRILPAALLLKAAALALRAVPQLNGTFEGGEFRPGSGIHVGWAVSLRGGGLIAPAIRDTDTRTLTELMASLRDLVQRARVGGLRSSELTLPTITLTNLGERGADSVSGIIYPPQVALVGFGRIASRPWVVNSAVMARPLVTVSLAADHRVTDGHVGAQLLNAIDQLLQEPTKL